MTNSLVVLGREDNCLKTALFLAGQALRCRKNRTDRRSLITAFIIPLPDILEYAFGHKSGYIPAKACNFSDKA